MTQQEEDMLRQQQQKLAGIPTAQQLQNDGGTGAAPSAQAPQTAAPVQTQGAAQQSGTRNLFAKPATTTTQPPQAQKPAVQPRAASNSAPGVPIDGQSETAGADYLSGLFTSMKREEDLRRASINKQRILALGDIGRHIANMVGTVNYANPMQFNNPVLEEQQRYLQEKAYRDKNNIYYMNYQQAKAAQDAKAKQWAADYAFKVEKDARDAAENKRKNDAAIAYQNANTEAAKMRAAKTEKEMGWVDKLNEDKLKNSESQRAARRAATAQGWSRVNIMKKNYEETVRHHKASEGGSGGSSAPYQYATPKGHVSSKKNFTAAQMDQVVRQYSHYLNKGDVARMMAEAGINTTDPSQVRRFQFAQLLLEHQDVADFVAQRFGWEATDDNVPSPIDPNLKPFSDEMGAGVGGQIYTPFAFGSSNISQEEKQKNSKVNLFE